jgi:DNA-binding transcriptional regulator YiaG
MIKTLRKALGWSVNDLSTYIEVDERTVRRWEYGERPTPKAVILLLELLNSKP